MAGKGEGKALDYTAESNVVPEAEERKKGGRSKRASGGRAADRADGGRSAERADGGSAPARAPFKRGGAVKKHVSGEGHKSRLRLDRRGRKRGGGVGADARPLTTAAHAREAGAHKADNDELEE